MAERLAAAKARSARGEPGPTVEERAVEGLASQWEQRAERARRLLADRESQIVQADILLAQAKEERESIIAKAMADARDLVAEGQAEKSKLIAEGREFREDAKRIFEIEREAKAAAVKRALLDALGEAHTKQREAIHSAFPEKAKSK
jgi:hypothetical protein